MAAGITDLMDRVTDSTTGRPVISALAAPGKAIAAASINLSDVTNWTTASAIHFSIYKTMVVGGVTVKDPTTQTDWKGVLVGSTIGSLTLTGGTDRAYVAGDIVELTPTARYAKDLYELLTTLFNQDATLKPGPIQTALNLGAGSLNGWNALGFAPNTVTPNGNRSYDLVFNGTDLSGTLSAGMRLRTARTVAAPNQCASLNGTTQSFSKAAPGGMAWTDDFVAGGWIKLSSYSANDMFMVSRYNGTSGWYLRIRQTGANSAQVGLYGFNAGSANYSGVFSLQSIPLNKWVHIAAQLDMSTFTATPTTSYIMIDGIDVPAAVERGGTNPVALVQAGNLEIGTANAIGFLPGKIAQTFVSSAKITQANVRTIISQGITATDVTNLSLASAYSLSNSLTDLNTTSANNLTANGAATTTTADAPFGNQVDGTISTTLDYAIIQKVVFSTNTTVTVQVAEGCAIPSSGGVASVVYSVQKAPYLFPGQKGKWRIEMVSKVQAAQAAPVSGTWYNPGPSLLNIPVGEWFYGYEVDLYINRAAGQASGYITLSTANNSETDAELSLQAYGNSIAEVIQLVKREKQLSSAAMTPYYLNAKTDVAGINSLTFLGTAGPTKIYADNAYV